MELTERKVLWHPKTLTINQIPSEGLEYAFLSEDYQQIHQLVWCKDFMQDAIFGYINQREVQIYGFKYDPKTMLPLYMDATRIMLVNWKDVRFGSKICNRLRPFLHAIEDQLKIPRTVFERCSNPPPRYRKSGVYIVNGDKRWMHSPPMISLYTLLLRVGMMHMPGRKPFETLQRIGEGRTKPYYNKDDKRFVKNAQKGLDAILCHGDRKLFHRRIQKNYPAKAGGINFSLYLMHDCCGIVGYSSGSTRSNFPHWHRFEKSGEKS